MNTITIPSSPPKIKDGLASVLEQLKIAESSGEYATFYDHFKASSLPVIPSSERNVEMCFEKCFHVLHELSKVSIPVSVAISMHYYLLSAIASYPFSLKSSAYWKRELLLRKINKEGLLIANTGSVRTYKDARSDTPIVAEKVCNQYVIDGETPFMSLAGVADYFVFTATLEQGEKAVFFIPTDTKGISFHDSPIGNSMPGSYTRSVRFDHAIVNDTNVLELNATEASNSEILVYQRSWFQSLLPACYLGAALRVISKLKDFSLKKVKHGKLLAESDCLTNQLGSLTLSYRTARVLCKQAATALHQFRRGNKHLLEQLFETSALAKYHGTQTAENIIHEVRKLMGVAFMAPDSVTEKAFRHVVFGPLQPMSNQDVVGYFGDVG